MSTPIAIELGLAPMRTSTPHIEPTTEPMIAVTAVYPDPLTGPAYESAESYTVTPVTTLPATGNNPQDDPSVALMALVLVAGTLGIYKLLRSQSERLGVVGDAPEGWDI